MNTVPLGNGCWEQVPDEWSVLPLRRVLKPGSEGIKMGPFGSQLRLEYLQQEGKYKVYGQENVISGDFAAGDKYLSVDKFNELTACEIEPGDVVITMMGTAGRCAVVPPSAERGIMDSHLVRLRLRPAVVLPRFAAVLFDETQYVKYLLVRAAKGSIMQGLNSSILKNILLAIPPLSQQRMILGFLDNKIGKLTSLINKKYSFIKTLIEKRSALISRTVTRGLPREAARAAGLEPNPKLTQSGVEWLGEVPEHWVLKPLGYLVRFQGGATPDKSHPEFWDGSIPWVSPKDMKKPVIEDSKEHISEEGLTGSHLVMVPRDAVLIVVRGMILSHSFPVALTVNSVTINQDMKALLCQRLLRPKFLYWLLEGFSRMLVSLADESAHGTRKLETSVIAKLRVLVPPIPEQYAIADFLDRETAKMEALIAKIKQAIERLQEYRTALITAAVTGKIDVRQEQSRRGKKVESPAQVAAHA